jgi:hypothetical protein
MFADEETRDLICTGYSPQTDRYITVDEGQVQLGHGPLLSAKFKYWKALVWDKMCVSDDTEALTPNGWQPRCNLKVGDLIASVERPKTRLVWRPIEAMNSYSVINEPMVHVKTSLVDMLMTENHNLFIRGRELITAKDLLSMSKHNWKIPVGAESHLHGRNGYPGSLAVAELKGWYVAEGSPLNTGALIYQTKSQGRNRIKSLLDKLEWTYTNRPDRFYVHASSAQDLRSYGKTIRRESLSWPEPEMRAFFNGLVGGDGHLFESGRCHFWQKDKDQIDLFQELSIKLGYSCNVNKCKGKNLWIASARLTRWTSFRQSNVYQEMYSGIVWCPTVDTGYWLARRNGKPFITGNSRGMGYHFPAQHEFIIMAEKVKGSKHRRLNNNAIGDVVSVKRLKGKAYYPTEKPIELIRVLIFESTNEGDCVLDPFAGSGVVGIACRGLKRQFILGDIEPKEALRRLG